MLGASLHGVSRTELSIYADTQFSFSQVHQDFLMSQQNQPPPPAVLRPATPLSTPKLEEGEELGVKEEEVEVETAAGVGVMGAQLQSTPLSHHDDKSRGRSWGFKGERSRGRKAERRAAEGGEEGGRGSDSDSDSESGSSSSERSASSDESGESDGGTGKPRGRRETTESCPMMSITSLDSNLIYTEIFMTLCVLFLYQHV